jgi:hypothetical protein
MQRFSSCTLYRYIILSTRQEIRKTTVEQPSYQAQTELANISKRTELRGKNLVIGPIAMIPSIQKGVDVQEHIWPQQQMQLNVIENQNHKKKMA